MERMLRERTRHKDGMIVGGWFQAVSPKKRAKMPLYFNLTLKFGAALPKTQVYPVKTGA